jgi:hypothetical protein
VILQDRDGKQDIGLAENGNGVFVMNDIEEIILTAHKHGIYHEVLDLAAKLLQTTPYKFYPKMAYEHAYIQIYESIKT